MKRLWAAVSIILLLIALTLLNVFCLGQMTQTLTRSLVSAQDYAEQNDWPQAVHLTRQARDSFNAHSFYLHVTLRHEDIDAIEVSFQEALEFLAHPQQLAEYTAVNARLIAQLGLLSEAELPTLKNIL